MVVSAFAMAAGMIAAFAAGGLYAVDIDGELAGVIAARPGVVRGIPGWEMVEEVLDGGYRGRGFAARMQRSFLDRLDMSMGEVVIGTIDHENTPSLRTAQRVGRLDVGGWIFIGGDPHGGAPRGRAPV